MKLKNVARAAAVAMTVAVAGTTLAVQPASAATVYVWGSTQGQYDNNPGSGAQSWIWVWTSNANGAWIEWQYYDGTGGSLGTTAWNAASANLPKDIWRIKLCERFPTGDHCSAWT